MSDEAQSEQQTIPTATVPDSPGQTAGSTIVTRPGETPEEAQARAEQDAADKEQRRVRQGTAWDVPLAEVPLEGGAA
jgi:hypothetical protein